MPPQPTGGSGGFWGLVLVWLIVSVPFAARWLGGENQGLTAVAAGASPEESEASFVKAERTASGVYVPEGAVVIIDGKASVVVAERDLKLLVATPVVLGGSEGHTRQILGGVNPGQYVIADGRSAHLHTAMFR